MKHYAYEADIIIHLLVFFLATFLSQMQQVLTEAEFIKPHSNYSKIQLL